MSILLVEVVPQGMIFGADRNISWSTQEVKNGQVIIKNLGHTQRSKVLRWPEQKALIGYAGVAEIGGVPSDEWLYDFIGRNANFSDFENLAEKLRAEVENQRRTDEGSRNPDGLLIHLGGFEKRNGVYVPVIYFIRNSYSFKDGYYDDIRKEYQKSEEFWNYFKNPPQDIQSRLDELASDFNPFWFHQGFDLGTFNTLEGFLKFAFKNLCSTNKSHAIPKNLSEWVSQVKMSILTYGSYFQAYKGPTEQFVGGGVDVVSIPWP